MALSLLWAFLISLIVGLVLTPVFSWVMLKLGIVSRPIILRADKRGLPLSGISIYLAFVIATISGILLFSRATGSIYAILVGSSLIVILGFYDDKKELSPQIKLFAEVAVAFLLIGSGISVKMYFLYPIINVFLTAVWFLAVTNAFNLLDILDGLACGIAIISSLTFLLVAALVHNQQMAIMSASLAGGGLAFLRYNFPPAKVIMGDSGSLFLGFVLASIALEISYAPFGREVALLTPLLILGLPLYDTLFVMVMRATKGKSIFRKSNDHLSLRLMNLGFDQKRTVIAMYLFDLFFCACAILISRTGNKFGLIILLVVIICSIVSRRLSRVQIDG
jgi:UDP-GlcNAc:undecaprenyl-phosphate GlcNAc-1-phosphate transferase